MRYESNVFSVYYTEKSLKGKACLTSSIFPRILTLFQQCPGISNLFDMSAMKTCSLKLYPVVFEVNRSFVIGFKRSGVKILINAVSSTYQSKVDYS